MSNIFEKIARILKLPRVSQNCPSPKIAPTLYMAAFWILSNCSSLVAHADATAAIPYVIFGLIYAVYSINISSLSAPHEEPESARMMLSFLDTILTDIIDVSCPRKGGCIKGDPQIFES